MMSAKSSTQTPRTTINKHLSSTRKTRSSSFAQSQRRGQKNRRFCLPVVNGGDDMIIVQNEIIKEAEPLLSQSSSFSDSLLEAGIEPWQLYFGFFAGIAPFIIAAYEFGKRILIQRKCALCQGSGLIRKGEYSRKCTACGGFLPWESWERFLDVGTAAKIGNGGRVRVPEGQTSVFYDVEKTVLASEKRKAVLEEESSLRRVAAAENPPAVEDKRKESSTK
ncbi:unnamed protein product [Bathycoccus prasinos]